MLREHIRCRPTWLAISAFIMLALPVSADPILDLAETWDAGQQGWDNQTDFANISNPSDYLELAFGALGAPAPGQDYDMMYTTGSPATDNYTGNYAGVGFASFDILADDIAPADLELRFGVSTNARVWSYNLDTSKLTVDQWTTYEVPFKYGSGWADGPGAGQAEFLADLGAVDWIGIYVKRDGLGAQAFGLDNFMLYVPEPGEILLVIVALAGLFRLVRKQRLLDGVHS